MNSLRLSVGVMSTALLVACGERRDVRAHSADMVDAAELPASSSGWTFVPEMRIDGESELLSNVGPLSVSKDGWIALLDNDEHSVRFYGIDGRALGAVGRDGAGPGEFRNGNRKGWMGDTLWVWDTQLSRYTVISPAREFVRTVTPRLKRSQNAFLALSHVYVWAIYPDGTYAGLGSGGKSPAGYEGRSPIVRISADGTLERILGWTPENRAFVRSSSSTGRGASRIPFRGDPIEMMSEDGDRLVFIDAFVEGSKAGSYVVTVIDATGDTITHRRYPFELDEIPASVADSARRAAISRRADRPEAAAALRRATLPPAYWPLRRLLIGTDNTLWLGMRARGGGTRWIVMDERGEPLDTITLPVRTSPIGASRQTLWVSQSNEDDVPSIIRYRIER